MSCLLSAATRHGSGQRLSGPRIPFPSFSSNPLLATTTTVHIANLSSSNTRISSSRRHSMVPIHRGLTLPPPPRKESDAQSATTQPH